ncbi:MAG: ATP-dependent Clp protease proteolytic subunit, partial [Nanoarchaeota archaeon]
MGKVKTILFILISLWVIALITSWFVDAPRFSPVIAIIPLEGMIHGGTASFFGTGGTSSLDFIAQLEKAAEDSAVKGIIVQINSPGGTVVASKEIADAIKAVDKPTVAWIREAGTSGAYWVATASDAIVA